MNGLTITGSLTKDIYEFIVDKIKKIDKSQTGEQGFYLMGQDQELKIKAKREQTGEYANGLEITLLILELVKDVGVELLAGLLVEFIRDRIKSKKETHEELAKKFTIIKTGDIKQIEMINYSPEEIMILKPLLG